MRISKDDIERILKYLEAITERFQILDRFRGYVREILGAIRQEERTVLARVKVRLADEIDKLLSRDVITEEDEIKLRTLEEVMKIIREEESKKDILNMLD